MRSSWLPVVFVGSLSHDRSNQVVSEQVSPCFLANKIWCLATQDVHLHRLLERSQIKLGIPLGAIKCREAARGNLLGIQQGRDNDDGSRAEPRLLDLEEI